MIQKMAWSIGVLLALALAFSGCRPDQKELTAGKAFLVSAQNRLSTLENAEAKYHQRDFRCGDQPKSKVDAVIGDLVEARVMAREELSRLKQEGPRTIEHFKAELEPTLRKAESKYAELEQLCPTT